MGLVESGKLPKPLTKLLNISRKYSLWMYQWGLACCAIEMAARHGRAALRHHAPRRHPAAGLAPPGRPALRVRHRHRQDGPVGAPALGADARPQVRHLHGLAAPTAAARTGTATR